ncbi:hypothetical protein MXB_2869 [Myxobolus squamalis]|nr:hypothetical protein MXB_2869 [Myxobolus squamalis]
MNNMGIEIYSFFQKFVDTKLYSASNEDLLVMVDKLDRKIENLRSKRFLSSDKSILRSLQTLKTYRENILKIIRKKDKINERSFIKENSINKAHTYMKSIMRFFTCK